jgi:RNA polymerase sigma-B factor
MTKKNKDLRLSGEQQILAGCNLNLARNIAWKYHRSTNIEYAILESAAFEGLCQAAAKYDPELLNEETGMPMRFSSLAVPYIRGSILHYIRDKTYSMRLTHRMRELWVKGRRMLNKGYTDLEISIDLGISLKEWQDTKSACSGPPLELKDQANPSKALEPDEIDRLEPFVRDVEEALDKMPEAFLNKLLRFCRTRSGEPSKALRSELGNYLPLK